MWFELSLFFALWTSIGVLIIKKLIRDINPLLFLVITNLFALPFIIILLLYLGIPKFSFDFFKYVFVDSIFAVVAGVLYFKAISISDISLISPISSFNPVFTLFFAFIFLGEHPTPLKLLGILVIVIGSYLLNITDIKGGILKPFSNLLSDKGVRLFLLTNLIWGLTPIFEKKAIFATQPISPISIPLAVTALTTIYLFPILFKEKNYKKKIMPNIKLFIILAIGTAFSTLAAQTAFSLTNLGYATAIFKLSTLFTIILGAIFFNEKRIKERFLGAAVMVIGTLLLVF